MPEPPWPAKADERVPPARPPPKPRRMSLEELAHAVGTFPHKKPAVKRVRCQPVKTPPGGRSHADVAASSSGSGGPSPAQAGKGPSTPGVPKPVKSRVPPSERLGRRTASAPDQPHGVYMSPPTAKVVEGTYAPPVAEATERARPTRRADTPAPLSRHRGEEEEEEGDVPPPPMPPPSSPPPVEEDIECLLIRQRQKKMRQGADMMTCSLKATLRWKCAYY